MVCRDGLARHSIMKMRLTAGSKFLIQGPASLRLISGESSTLGMPIEDGETITVRAGRLKIVEAARESELDIVIGQSGRLEEIDASTIPVEWTDFLDKQIAEQGLQKPRIMVLGGLDTGKNTFITYGSNLLLKRGFKVAVMDADMGQGEIGPPTTMALALLGNPISELIEAKPNYIYFVGSISPALVVDRVLRGAEALVNNLQETSEEFTLFVNMPGWITGPSAARFILDMVAKAKIDLLVVLQKQSEVEHVVNGVPSTLRVVRLPVSDYARPRSREERKFLRDTSYRKYFAHSTETAVRYHKIDFSPLFSSRGKTSSLARAREVERVTGSKVLLCEENGYSINAILANHVHAPENSLVEVSDQRQAHYAEEDQDRKGQGRTELRAIAAAELENIVVGLFEKTEANVSLGILRRVDLGSKRASVITSIEARELERIEVGKVKIGPQGYEMGFAEPRIFRVDGKL